MSKKSRRRNKKILAALALAGGAAMLGRRGKGTGAVSTAGQAVGVDRITPKTDYITKKANVVPNTSRFQTRFTTQEGIGPNELSGYSKRVTGVDHPILTQARIPPGGMRRFKGGGRVTGIAKRGFGRALKRK